MKTKLTEMFKIQDKLNTNILGDYKSMNVPFYRAAIVECAELYDHVGYKWWKHSDNYDEYQAKMEIVDIYHFLMSSMLSEGTECIDFMKETLELLEYSPHSKEEKLESVDYLIQDISNGNHKEYISSFFSCMCAFNLTFDELFNMYIGKNVLNVFRQKHGYKDGSYNKEEWVAKNGDFVEDNVVLEEILEYCDTYDSIYSELEKRYPN